MAVSIVSLEIENVKRIKAVKMAFDAQNKLSVIGGDNCQGKTSILDSICWALGGNKKSPSLPKREGSVGDPYIKLELSNGLIVERKGKNSTLKITDPSGEKVGQQLINSFVSELALDLPKFLEAKDKDKADTLLKIIGVGDKLAELDATEKEFYDERLFVGRQADSKQKYANELPAFEELGYEMITPSELIAEQQSVMTHNAKNEALRNDVKGAEAKAGRAVEALTYKENQISELKSQLAHLEGEKAKCHQDVDDANKELSIARSATENLEDKSTAEFEQKLKEIDDLNSKISANLDKQKAEEDAQGLKKEYTALTHKIEDIREERMKLLSEADLPLEGLSVESGKLLYQGQQWDCMSGAEQLRVATAIVRKLNPNCGFVLLDKLEQMDMTTVNEFAEWLEKEGLQVIATKVSKGDECSFIIEDGKVVSEPVNQEFEIKGGF